MLQQVRDNPKRAEMVVSLAIAAWNKAMLPVEKQPGIEKEIIDTLVPKGGRAEDVGVICEVMDAIEERRKKLFPKLRRDIATHDFKMSHGKMMLNVGSAIIRLNVEETDAISTGNNKAVRHGFGGRPYQHKLRRNNR